MTKRAGKAKSDLARAELQARAVDLRRAGQSYAAIAELTGEPKTTVFRLVRAALEDYQARTAADIAEHVSMQLIRLDRALAAIDRRVTGGNLTAIDALLRIEARRARLLGLDAPQKVAPTTPDGAAPYEGGGLAEMLAEARQLRKD